jgi:2-polyprenyl-3-methyl-5-hydroxy-6-metoxy-1,4-benzoquinol methylase
VREPDATFADPRQAVLYDFFNGDRRDLEAYVRIAHEVEAQRVVDVGCGTGSLAVRLAEQGFSVTGVDPACAPLDVARASRTASS